MAVNFFAETLLQNVKVYNTDRTSFSRYLQIDCPFCPTTMGKEDTKGHMHFFNDSNFGHCMRCGMHVNAARLFKKLDLRLPVNDYLLATDEAFGAVRSIVKPREVHNLLPPPPIENPTGIITFDIMPRTFVFNKVWRRVERDWGLTAETVIDLSWGWDVHNDSFYFPVYMNDELVFWQTRSYDGTIKKSVEGDFGRYGLLGNFDCELKYDTNVVYLVEGAKDAAALYQEGLWGVYLFGHVISSLQKERLDKLSHEKVILLDNDTISYADELGRKYGWKVLHLPHGDPADHVGNLRTLLDDSVDNAARRIQSLLRNDQLKHGK